MISSAIKNLLFPKIEKNGGEISIWRNYDNFSLPNIFIDQIYFFMNGQKEISTSFIYHYTKIFTFIIVIYFVCLF